jgi:plasmid stabilization system protein ParE
MTCAANSASDDAPLGSLPARERILVSPQSFPLIHGQIRRVVLSRFPYAVYFREQGTEILVIALHGRQDPRRWKQRT